MRNHLIFLKALFFFLGIILSAGIFFVSGVQAEPKENIRVLVSREPAKVIISGQELVLQDLKTGQSFFKNLIFSSLTIEREEDSRLRVRGYPISAQGLSVTSSNGPLLINGRRYRNRLQIIPGQNKGIWVINELPLEEYLIGLINCEISSQWPWEAVKAQAVVARTYAIFQKRNRLKELYDLDSGVQDQVYEGMGKEDASAQQAVMETEEEVLLYSGNPILAFYHSCCGGKTESSEHFLNASFPYLRGIVCNYCLDSPYFFWTHQVDSESLRKILGNGAAVGSKVLGIEIGERSASGRIRQVYIKGEKGQLEVAGKEFRRLLGYDLLRSSNFMVRESDGTYFFSGQGWGHGVGLCQWGAKRMAENGAGYQTILKYYYQSVEIGKIPR